jgi:branched-chain amino acid transport system permease protein
VSAALRAHPARLRASNVARTAACVALVVVAAAALTLVFGRTGERIAVQMCVNVAGVVALGVFCGNSGIVSFGHGAFMAVGAYLSGILTMPAMMQRTALPALPDFLAGHELSVWAAAPIVALAGLAFAAASGVAISRLVGASATIATLGLLIITHGVAIGAREITRGSQTFFGVPRATDLTVALSAAVLFILVARAFRESRWGLTMRAARDDPAAATALGIDPRRARFIAWCASGVMATLAGALYGHMLGAFSPASFYMGLTFAYVAMLVVGGIGSVGGAVAGVVGVTLLQDAVRQAEGGFELFGVALPPVFGLTTVALGVAILLTIWLRPQGLVGRFELGPSPASRLFDGVTRATEPAPAPPQTPEARDAQRARPLEKLRGPEGGRRRELRGADRARHRADRAERRRKIDSGEPADAPIRRRFRLGALRRADLLATAQHGIARTGLGRSFQNLRLFGALTAYENVYVAGLAAGHAPGEAARIAIRELEAFGLDDAAGKPAESLPYGARKRLEIARCLAQAPAMILLDEPAAGMNPAETDDLADRLIRVGEERGVGILLIDHDLRFVNRLSERIVVMNRGQVIAEGAPAEIRADPAVIEAYIGRGRAAADVIAREKQDAPTEGVET